MLREDLPRYGVQPRAAYLADDEDGRARRASAATGTSRDRAPRRDAACYSPAIDTEDNARERSHYPSAPSDTTAVILGRPRPAPRPLTDRTHKALLPVGGHPILAWMLGRFTPPRAPLGGLVVGIARIECGPSGPGAGGMAIEFLHNPDYAKGSALSLYAARDVLPSPTLIMDADVVFPREFLLRLLRSAEPNAFLIDEEFQDTGEEVKIYVQDDRVIALGKKVVPEAWDLVGEGIGFLKCGPEAGRVLVTLLEQVIAESDGASEYEDALHLLVKQQWVAAIRVGGLPWTEVDFAADLYRARTDVFPRISRLDAPDPR